MKENNIEMIRGDTLAFGIKIELHPDSGDSSTLNVSSIFMTVKNSLNGSPIVQLYRNGDEQDDNHSITKVEDGLYRVHMCPEDSNKLEAGQYYYDVQITCNGDRFTILYGVLQVYEDVTK